MTPKVKIIILNWNGWEDTLECLESLYQINYPNYDIILVDNASHDDSIERIREYCDGEYQVESSFIKHDPYTKPIELVEISENDTLPDIWNKESSSGKLLLLKNSKNHGFAEGNNIAMKYALQSDPDYVMLLNNDTVVGEDFLDKLVEVSESDAKIGVAAPLIYFYDHMGKTDVPANIGGRVNMSKYPGYYDLVDEETVKIDENVLECDWVSGAAMMLKTKTVPLKYLNNQLFFGNEDIDLCINLKNRGYKIVSVHTAKIWHKEGVSRKKRSSALIQKVLLEIEVNLKFLKMHQKHYYRYLPIYIIQIIILYVNVASQKILK